MKVGDTIQFEGQSWQVLHIEDRNTYEPLPGVTQIGNVVVLQNTKGEKIAVYDFDL